MSTAVELIKKAKNIADGTDYTGHCMGIWVGTQGNLVVVHQNDEKSNKVTYYNFVGYLNVEAKQVLLSEGTASGVTVGRG